MAPRSGLSAQLGISTETTYGTYVAPTTFYELETESLAHTIARMDVQDLRSGAFVQRTDRWAAGQHNVQGDLALSVKSNGYAKLFHHMLGAVSNIADGTGYHYTIVPGDLAGLSLTAQVGRPDLGGTVQPFSYCGLKCASWQISNTSSDQMKLKYTIDGQSETTSQTLASPSYIANSELLFFTEGSVTVGGSTLDVMNWSVTGTNAMHTNRYYISSTTPTLKREPVRNAYSNLGGTLVIDFNGLTAYNRFINSTTAAIVLTYTGVNTYDTGKFNKIVITIPNARFEGTTPNVSGPDILQQSLPFVALDDGTNAAVQIEVYTADVPTGV
ncbi:MAG: phage tail tube protein [Mycobacteriales bacterium]